MADKIGPRIELEGEREFKKAVTEINAGLKVTGSELKMVTAQFARNSQSVEALTAKNTVLNKQYTAQLAKVKELEGMLNKAKEVYDDNNKVTLTYQERLNRAKAELYNTKNALDQNVEALEKAKEKTDEYSDKQEEVTKINKSAGDVIADMANALGISLPAGAEQAIRSLDKAKISTMALVAVSAGLIKKFAETTIETAKAADEILTLSTVSGLTTDQIQKLNYASELMDVSTETITGSMTKMIRNMNNARMGSKQAEEAFKALRIRIKDSNGELRDAETVFGEVIDRLGKMKNETERDAIAMQIFGRSARELTPLIEAGSEELKKLGDEAERMGYVMDKGALESLGELDDAMQRFQNQTTSFKNSIAMVMLPVLTALFEILNKIDPKVVAIVAIIGTMALVTVSVVKAISSVTNVFKTFDFEAHKTTLIIIGVVAALITLAAIIAVIIGKGGELERTMAGIGESAGQIQGHVTNAQNNYKPPKYRYVHGSHASGIDYVPYDGYIAELHRGERVLTAEENQRGRGDTYILQIKLEEVSDVQKVVKVFKDMRQANRAGKLVTI